MYSNKENVNILTALLVEHGIRHAVVCPGSRNSPIVHNLNECLDIQCFPVTDERSAAFYALGIAQTGRRVAVCVTSGTALLNVAPAAAEAYYQRKNIVIISADRPQQWIDQLDGQTLPQPDALGRFVRKAVHLPEPHDDEERWYCNRLVNEALMEQRGPVHINVPISEPLFEYSTAALPQERKIELTAAEMPPHVVSHVCQMFMQAKRPMLIAGQPWNPHMDEAVAMIGDDEIYIPDFVVYTGGSIVSKRLKRFLRKAKETWIVNETGEVTDTFQNATHVLTGDGQVVAEQIRSMLAQQPHPFCERWQQLLQKVAQHIAAYEPAYSQMAVVRRFEQQRRLKDANLSERVHYANSMSARLANIYSQCPFYCNRGVNGIEGSLSTAAGMSCVVDETVYCVIGDLSFFYDQNALWNQNLRGNLRILLLNNGKGGIFNMLKGLEQSPARDPFVSAAHHTTAEGICRQNDVVYLKAGNMDEMQQGIDILLNRESPRPMLLEVFTDAAEDERVFKAYYNSIIIC